MSITGTQLAKAARDAYNQFKGQKIPNRGGGSTPEGFDTGGFIMYCFRQCGHPLKIKGTNDLFRRPHTWKDTLENTRKSKMAVDGAIAFIVKHDGGERKHSYTDGDNADCAGIVSNGQIIYYSATNEAICETRINSSTRGNWWSHFVHLKDVSY
ncbi:MAG: hypothetical protein GXY67_07795 [Clostridiales bacterium]|nr:hypothetical protein [Clostridiales bacterium]